MQDGAGEAAGEAAPALEPWQDDFATIYASGLFDHIWYATRYPEVGLTDLSPLEHYVKYGARLGRQPRADFTAPPDETFDGSFVNPFAAWIRARAETEPAPAWNRPVVSVLCTAIGHYAGCVVFAVRKYADLSTFKFTASPFFKVVFTNSNDLRFLAAGAVIGICGAGVALIFLISSLMKKNTVRDKVEVSVTTLK